MPTRSLFAIALVVIALLPWAPAAHSAEWTDTRVGAFDFVCEAADGTLVSGHQRFSLAAKACAAAKVAHPQTDYQVRGAAYRISLVAAAPPPPATPAAYSVVFSPSCSLPVTLAIGAFVMLDLTHCFEGDDVITAAWGVTAPANGWSIAKGLLTHPAFAAAESGVVSVSLTGPWAAVVAPISWSAQ
ncbi:MAG: hypothetical protein ABI640_13055 [Gammaproteobacteria bacterium]